MSYTYRVIVSKMYGIKTKTSTHRSTRKLIYIETKHGNEI